MSHLFQNKYRIKSIRLADWDYSENGYYFVTICTKDRKEHFGSIEQEKNVLLDEYIIMPNHLHGILIIDNPVEICHGMSLLQNKFSRPIKKSLSVIINHYKSAVTRWTLKNNCEYFDWQPRFYEHIIVMKNL